VAAGGASAVTRADATDEDAAALAARVRHSGGTVVATGGCFDLLHAGHVRMLEAARALGDCLIVCLNSDASVSRLKGDDRPLVSQDDRAAVLEGLACVDAVAIFEEDDPRAVLATIKPHICAKGGDYAVAELPEAQTLAEWGGRAVIVPYVPGRSTTRLITEVLARAR
jgi:rfaE bifunctional protein nucleotidyltransferase chain/domain